MYSKCFDSYSSYIYGFSFLLLFFLFCLFFGFFFATCLYVWLGNACFFYQVCAESVFPGRKARRPSVTVRSLVLAMIPETVTYRLWPHCTVRVAGQHVVLSTTHTHTHKLCSSSRVSCSSWAGFRRALIPRNPSSRAPLNSLRIHSSSVVVIYPSAQSTRPRSPRSRRPETVYRPEPHETSAEGSGRFMSELWCFSLSDSVPIDGSLCHWGSRVSVSGQSSTETTPVLSSIMLHLRRVTLRLKAQWKRSNQRRGSLFFYC